MKKVFLFLQPLFHKRVISALLKGLGGCYIWINLSNGHRYVGSSIDLVSRIFDHLKRSNSILLQRAFEKHGHDCFKLIVIVIPNATKENVLVLEQYLIDTLRPEYNILKVAGSSAGAVIGPMSSSRKATSRKWCFENGTYCF
jgi:group I intron endonuclease